MTPRTRDGAAKLDPRACALSSAAAVKARLSCPHPALLWDASLSEPAETWAAHLIEIEELKHRSDAQLVGTGHRANVLGPYERVRTAAAKAPSGMVYLVVTFFA